LSSYCREIEDHLTRVNGGHLVRIVAIGFETVRHWAEAGIPLSVVMRGIELKADRHRLGSSTRPLRIEFCDADVRDVFEQWRRAVGVIGDSSGDAGPAEPQKRPSLTKHLDRVIDRLTRVAGRIDLPDEFLSALAELLQELSAIRETAKGARGDARAQLVNQLAPLDDRVVAAARAAASADLLARLESQSADELAAFRDRLAGDSWQRALTATVDRLLRDHFGLPTITM
jgi:hypothetical protein